MSQCIPPDNCSMLIKKKKTFLGDLMVSSGLWSSSDRGSCICHAQGEFSYCFFLSSYSYIWHQRKLKGINLEPVIPPGRCLVSLVYNFNLLSEWCYVLVEKTHWQFISASSPPSCDLSVSYPTNLGVGPSRVCSKTTQS
jgi:hypothetical protein